MDKEKPYYTKEERILYLKIAIDESIKQNNMELAAYYQRLLNLLENSDDSLFNYIKNHKKDK